MLFQKFTTEYQPLEDRIRVLGESAQGNTEAFWLTQRLLQKLVPVLADHLKEREHTNRAAEPLAGAEPSGAGASAPVHSTRGMKEWLAASVDITARKSGLVLDFKDAKGAESARATLQMTAPALRQWLLVLLVGYRNAGWPDHIWPGWLTREMGARVSLH